MHLPQIKSKNKKLKEKAENIIVNIKLLCFINHFNITKLLSKNIR